MVIISSTFAVAQVFAVRVERQRDLFHVGIRAIPEKKPVPAMLIGDLNLHGLLDAGSANQKA